MLNNQMVIWVVGVISNQFMAVHKAYKPTEKKPSAGLSYITI
jgi:hypothetical protein